jgi:hypothetical protein
MMQDEFLQRGVPQKALFLGRPRCVARRESCGVHLERREQDNFDIYVMPIPLGSPVRLTTDPAEDVSPKGAAPKRVIPGTGFVKGMGAGSRVPAEELRKDFTEGGFKVMGEIGLQYEGLSPSDPSVDQYFALAEQLDTPV